MHTDVTGDFWMEQPTITELILEAWKKYKHSHRPQEFFIEFNAFEAGWMACYELADEETK
jgi:hypothetical protein